MRPERWWSPSWAFKLTNRDAVFVQTDLKNFSHNIEIVPLIHFFKRHYPWAENTIACLSEVKQECGTDTLPISWILSRFISNIVSQHFHAQFRPHLERNLRSTLEREIEYEPKTKVYRLDVDSITVLKSNFAFLKTTDEYFLDDPDIRARIDEVLPPSDNDLTFNQHEQFRRNLMNLKRFVISKQELDEKEIEDLLSQIKLKVEKIITKIIRLLERRGFRWNSFVFMFSF